MGKRLPIGAQLSGLLGSVIALMVLLLGVVLYGEESHEVINTVVSTMLANQPYTVLANQIFTHPTMAEALNDLFGLIK